MTDTILCIDIGTSSLKAALLPDNFTKNKIFVSRQPFPERAFREHDSACYYLGALKAALAELHENCPDYAIEAICVSGNGPTVISDDGTTLLYSDSFAFPNYGDSVQKETFLKNTKSLFIPRFFAFNELFNESWKNSAHIFGSPEFLIHELTGEAVSILPEERFRPIYWSEDELKRGGFSDFDIQKIPPFVGSGAFVGKVSEKAALETGLFEGTFVFAGAPDFVVALIGTGTILPGRLCDRAGTSEGLNLCTTQPICAKGLRTMPSVIPELWNVSYLLNPQISTDFHRLKNYNSSNLCESVDYLNELSHGISLLREAATANGEYFPDCMTITGGQALDDALIQQKEEATGLKIKKMPCADAELIGDLILARVSLGDYDDITEAVFAILGA
ncbi:MAG: hypothetical protein IJ158_13135 [Treponema sp.]|nr:hypothetical protein [Treponema sp.]